LRNKKQGSIGGEETPAGENHISIKTKTEVDKNEGKKGFKSKETMGSKNLKDSTGEATEQGSGRGVVV